MATAINRHELRYCDYCHSELKGRIDKKYCNDTCRNDGHRKQRKEEAESEPLFIRQINHILKRNRRLMHHQVARAGGPATIGRQLLLSQGFSFRFYTNSLSTKAGEYRFCYDYGWRELTDEKIMVVHNPNQASI